MRGTCWLLIAVVCFAAGCGKAAAPPVEAVAFADEPASQATPLELAGKTQPAPGKSAVLSPKALDFVEEVLVQVGDRVKKDQPVVKQADDGEQAELRSRKAALAELQASLARLKAEPREEEIKEARASLEACKITTKECQHLFARLKPLLDKGAISEQRIHEAETACHKCQAEERAAAARLERLLRRPFELEVAELDAKIKAAEGQVDVAEDELGDHTILAPIDGVVAWLDVKPGAVTRPGTSVWGEIIDLSELDVRCEVTPQQADQVATGHPAEVTVAGRKERWTGRVVNVGIAADPKTGRVPVLIRLKTPKENLRCYIEVKVRLGSTNQ